MLLGVAGEGGGEGGPGSVLHGLEVDDLLGPVDEEDAVVGVDGVHQYRDVDDGLHVGGGGEDLDRDRGGEGGDAEPQGREDGGVLGDVDDRSDDEWDVGARVCEGVREAGSSGEGPVTVQDGQVRDDLGLLSLVGRRELEVVLPVSWVCDLQHGTGTDVACSHPFLKGPKVAPPLLHFQAPQVHEGSFGKLSVLVLPALADQPGSHHAADA